jgi:hypothetical protein
MHEHLNALGSGLQMLMIVNQMASIFFLFLFFLFKNNLTSAKITLSFFRDARLIGGVTATDSTLGHSDHLLSVGIWTDGPSGYIRI